jgi:SAM-dependent methyltransferase
MLALIVASVWLCHGLVNKLLRAEPRHLAIVQSVPGFAGTSGQFVLAAVGVAEVAVAIWIISGWRPRACAVVQTAALLFMNAVELTFARHHLLWPAMLVPANLAFLAFAWIAAGWNPLYRLRRHPIPVRAHFDHSLVLTYAFPAHVLEPLLPPGLTLDTYGGYGFVAVAIVQTRDLRPVSLPRVLGQDFVLTGYRIFAKFKTPGAAGRTMRGLRILRSDADRSLMVAGGNVLTHYNYRKCDAHIAETADGKLAVTIRTPGGEADLDVVADLTADGTEKLPPSSPFRSLRDARKFAGPLPYTFDYEPQTHSIIAIKGVRERWSPRVVDVDVRRLSFFDRDPHFRGVTPILASAFHVRDIDYRWQRGVRHCLAARANLCQGVLQIARFNWPSYLAGCLTALASIVAMLTIPLPHWLRLVIGAGAAAALFWLVASLVVSHIVYDRSPLRRWAWVRDALGFTPRTWINLHAGLDESTPALRRLFANSSSRVFDFFDAADMTERSILRARRLAQNEIEPERVDFRSLPLADGSIDAAMLLLSAHELRTRDSRVALLRELRRVLAPCGKIILAEHLRDGKNFLAFGPGFLHFFSGREWRACAAAGGLGVEREFPITSFVRVFVLERRS